jgi:phage replication-related protein YjqB (UPF0714/DUF867 family)
MDEVLDRFAKRAVVCYHLHQEYVVSIHGGTDDAESEALLFGAMRSLLADFQKELQEVGKHTVARFISEVQALPHKQ